MIALQLAMIHLSSWIETLRKSQEAAREGGKSGSLFRQIWTKCVANYREETVSDGEGGRVPKYPTVQGAGNEGIPIIANNPTTDQPLMVVLEELVRTGAIPPYINWWFDSINHLEETIRTQIDQDGNKIITFSELKNFIYEQPVTRAIHVACQAKRSHVSVLVPVLILAVACVIFSASLCWRLGSLSFCGWFDVLAVGQLFILRLV
jgi:hypothetical protein